MIKWDPYSHPISDIKEWSEDSRLELRPDYQRKQVWSDAARIMLIDSVLRNIPIPKIFVRTEIKNNRTYRSIIDGQQRMAAILDFIRNKFSLDAPYMGTHRGKKFDQLSQRTRDRILSYKIDMNEIKSGTPEEIRELYSRVNKYLFPLNKQELRKADYPGDFYQVCDELALHSFFETARLFNAGQRRRSLDIEFVSELMAALISGVQDKKETLDSYYRDYMAWSENDKNTNIKKFESILHDMDKIFHSKLKPISATRFSQKADFYSFFEAIAELRAERGTLEDVDMNPLRDDLRILDEYIRPESNVKILSEYAVKCVSQANTASSRKWRARFLKALLQGSYLRKPPKQIYANYVLQLAHDLSENEDLHLFPHMELKCAASSKRINIKSASCSIGWRRDEKVFQLSNARWVYVEAAKNDGGWHILDRASGHGNILG